jgi:hypothetical protein
MIFGHDGRTARGLGNGHEKATCQYSAPGVTVRLRCDERIIEVSHEVGGPHAYPRSRTLSPRVIDAQAIERCTGNREGKGHRALFQLHQGLTCWHRGPWGCRAIVDQGGMVATSRTLSARTGHALLNHLSQHVGSR